MQVSSSPTKQALPSSHLSSSSSSSVMDAAAAKSSSSFNNNAVDPLLSAALNTLPPELQAGLATASREDLLRHLIQTLSATNSNSSNSNIANNNNTSTATPRGLAPAVQSSPAMQTVPPQGLVEDLLPTPLSQQTEQQAQQQQEQQHSVSESDPGLLNDDECVDQSLHHSEQQQQGGEEMVEQGLVFTKHNDSAVAIQDSDMVEPSTHHNSNEDHAVDIHPEIANPVPNYPEESIDAGVRSPMQSTQKVYFQQEQIQQQQQKEEHRKERKVRLHQQYLAALYQLDVEDTMLQKIQRELADEDVKIEKLKVSLRSCEDEHARLERAAVEAEELASRKRAAAEQCKKEMGEAEASWRAAVTKIQFVSGTLKKAEVRVAEARDAVKKEREALAAIEKEEEDEGCRQKLFASEYPSAANYTTTNVRDYAERDAEVFLSGLSSSLSGEEYLKADGGRRASVISDRGLSHSDGRKRPRDESKERRTVSGEDVNRRHETPLCFAFNQAACKDSQVCGKRHSCVVCGGNHAVVDCDEPRSVCVRFNMTDECTSQCHREHRCLRCMSSSHKLLSCPVPPLLGAEFCFAYNSCGLCKMTEDCSRQHKCIRCRGAHPSILCPDNCEEYFAEFAMALSVAAAGPGSGNSISSYDNALLLKSTSGNSSSTISGSTLAPPSSHSQVQHHVDSRAPSSLHSAALRRKMSVSSTTSSHSMGGAGGSTPPYHQKGYHQPHYSQHDDHEYRSQQQQQLHQHYQQRDYRASSLKHHNNMHQGGGSEREMHHRGVGMLTAISDRYDQVHDYERDRERGGRERVGVSDDTRGGGAARMPMGLMSSNSRGGVDGGSAGGDYEFDRSRVGGGSELMGGNCTNYYSSQRHSSLPYSSSGGAASNSTSSSNGAGGHMYKRTRRELNVEDYRSSDYHMQQQHQHLHSSEVVPPSMMAVDLPPLVSSSMGGGRTLSASEKAAVCRDYNNGKCWLDKCRYKHVCLRCGQSDHRERRCPLLNNGAPPPPPPPVM